MSDGSIAITGKGRLVHKYSEHSCAYLNPRGGRGNGQIMAKTQGRGKGYINNRGPQRLSRRRKYGFLSMFEVNVDHRSSRQATVWQHHCHLWMKDLEEGTWAQRRY